MPCYNAAPYVREAVESALAQTRVPLEIIVVNDRSTDGSMAQLADLNVTILDTPGRSGEAGARNLGIAHARGDYIATLDADDVWQPDHLETVAGLLDSFPEAVVACSGAEVFGDAGGQSMPTFPPNIPCNVLVDVTSGCPIPHPSTLLRRAMIGDNPYTVDPLLTYAPDFELWLRLAVDHPFVRAERPTIRYRVHESQLSRSWHKQLQAGWRARLAVIASGAGGDAFVRATAKRWRTAAAIAWRTRDFLSLQALVDVGNAVPGVRPLEVARWSLVRRLGPAVEGVWSRMPQRAKDLAKTVLGARGDPR
jgi:glycosyltransferase involved in cell wall biosynthesis